MSFLVHIFIIVFIAYWALAVVLYLMQPKFLYEPMRDVPYTPEDLGLKFEKVTLQTQDNIKLEGWFVPAENADITILFCHGNGGNMTHRLDSINIFCDLGLNCFIFDYRGYGNSHGKPTEQGTYIDAETAYKYLTETKKISPDNIIIFGRSLGGSIAAKLAGEVEVKALVIESTFTSYIDIGRKFYPYMPVKWFARFSYSTIDYIENVHCPVMIIHSRDDETIPFEFGRRLYENANEPKEFVEIYGSHNDGFLLSGDLYKNAWEKWIEFLQARKSQIDGQQAS